jgi:hypothetical protein
MIRQRLCDSLFAAGRTEDAGESLLKMINTLDEERCMSPPPIRWVSGEFIFNQIGCRAFKTSQISPTGASLLRFSREWR